MKKLAAADEIINSPRESVNMSFEEVSGVIEKATAVVKYQRKLLDLPEGASLVVGDIHGDLESMKAALAMLEQGTVDRVIFNGDVVDRGKDQVECLMLLSSMITKKPNSIFFLRGNHELRSVNSVYGFRGFVQNYWQEELYETCDTFFSQLPLAAKLGDRGFVTHGGVPNRTVYFHLMRLELKERNPKIGGPEWQMMWNDPDDRLKWFGNSIRGSGIYRFGKLAFKDFMDFHHLDYFIRAHSVVTNGFKWQFKNQLLTVFSSRAGPYFKVKPHAAVTEGGKQPSVVPLYQRG